MSKTKFQGNDRIFFNGTELVDAYSIGHCWHCGDSTHWFDINFGAYLCSEECAEAKWGEYFEARVRK
jgi:hypothetical protein